MCAIDSMGGGARGTRFTGNANSLVEYLTNVISIIISAQGFQCRLKGSQHQYGKCHQVSRNTGAPTACKNFMVLKVNMIKTELLISPLST